MSVETELAHELERSLAHLPSVPATDYLRAGRRARRRRRAVAGIAAMSIVALGAGGIAVWPDPHRPGTTTIGSDSGGPELPPAVADPGTPNPDYLAPEPNYPVEAVPGLAEGVDAYSTTEIPSWAEEFGRHGPVLIADDGRLWVAPDAVIRHSVVDPLQGSEVEGVPITAPSYAVEAEKDRKVRWVLMYVDPRNEGVYAEWGTPGVWTTDFELWVDDATARFQGRPSFAERLAHFAGGDPEQRLVPGSAGVELVKQVDGVELGPDSFQDSRNRAAEVRWAGRTWFVRTYVLRHEPPPYDVSYYAIDAEVAGSDFDGFLDGLRSGRW